MVQQIFSAGNFYGVLPYEGRYDAGYGTVLLNENNKGFKTPGSLQTGFIADGEIRDIKTIRTIKGKKVIAVAWHNNSIRIFALTENNRIGKKK
jgi:enediyne biosynthesis protein E4